MRSALRAIRRSPGFSLTVVLVAALGIGATAAAFAVTDHVLLRPLPFSRSDRLVLALSGSVVPRLLRAGAVAAELLDWQRESRSFLGMGAYSTWSSNMLGAGDPVRLDGATVTSSVPCWALLLRLAAR